MAMLTNVRLYEALKSHVGEEAAEMIAEVVPPAQNLATKEDIAVLKGDLLKWMIALFVPVWIGTYGTIIAIVLKG
jgi:hypothetical protein